MHIIEEIGLLIHHPGLRRYILSIANAPLPIDQHSHQKGSVAHRRDAGTALRKQVPRRSDAEWSPAPDRTDPGSRLEEQNRTRLQQRLPPRSEPISASPAP